MNVVGERIRPKWAALVMGLTLHAAWAAEPPAAASPTAQAALQTLLTSQVGRADPATKEVLVGAGAAPSAATWGSPGSTSAGAAVGTGGRTVVPVARGQTLDGLLRQHMADSPLRIEVQRELLRQLNPQAFAPGTGYRLLLGARLQMPTLHDQAQHAFGKVMAGSDVHAERQAEERSSSAGGGSAAAARKGWVRYP